MPQTQLVINGHSLSVEDVINVCNRPELQVEISEECLKLLGTNHKMLTSVLTDQLVYGANTGFGPMADRILPEKDLVKLQYNLVRSHACGLGEPLPKEYVLSAMLVRLNTLACGNSAVSSDLVQLLATAINKRFIPVVYEHGAVGTSGDLVQLAHIALGLIGEGLVYTESGLKPAKTVMLELGMEPYRLKPKEGLALINGTAQMSGIACHIVAHAEKLLNLSEQCACLSMEVVGAFSDCLDERLHELRPHLGQKEVAKRMRDLLVDTSLLRNREQTKYSADSTEIMQLSEVIQQVYSLRCVPQILGPLWESLESTKSVLNIELNSVTDNPAFDYKTNIFLHGGNFHGEYIAVNMDQLKIPLIKMSMLSERRVNFFLNTNANKTFPPFLNLKTPGLTLALQGLQFVATSTVANSQTYAFPHTVHSIPTNGDNQDLVSMGTDSTLLAMRVIDNAYILSAIEMVVLSQAVESANCFEKLSSSSRQFLEKIRAFVKVLHEDRSLQPEITALFDHLKNVKLNNRNL